MARTPKCYYCKKCIKKGETSIIESEGNPSSGFIKRYAHLDCNNPTKSY